MKKFLIVLLMASFLFSCGGEDPEKEKERQKKKEEADKKKKELEDMKKEGMDALDKL